MSPEKKNKVVRAAIQARLSGSMQERPDAAEPLAAIYCVSVANGWRASDTSV